MDINNLIKQINNLPAQQSSEASDCNKAEISSKNMSTEACQKCANLNTSQIDKFSQNELNDLLEDVGLEVSKDSSIKEMLVKFCIYIIVDNIISPKEESNTPEDNLIQELQDLNLQLQ